MNRTIQTNGNRGGSTKAGVWNAYRAKATKLNVGLFDGENDS
jgi:hypothetical protein